MTTDNAVTALINLGYDKEKITVRYPGVIRVRSSGGFMYSELDDIRNALGTDKINYLDGGCDTCGWNATIEINMWQ